MITTSLQFGKGEASIPFLSDKGVSTKPGAIQIDRVAGILHYCSTQRLPGSQEEAFRQAVEQLQHRHGGGRMRGEEVWQLLAQQFGVDYTLNGIYELLKRLDMA